jgi:signal transduction histidine kinase
MAEFKRIAADLHPAVLDKFGLIPALKKHCADFAKDTGLAVSFEIKGAMEVAPGPSSTALYRIAQQALTNVARHAQAKRIAVRLRRGKGSHAHGVRRWSRLRREEPRDARSGRHRLISMRERVAAFAARSRSARAGQGHERARARAADGTPTASAAVRRDADSTR